MALSIIAALIILNTFHLTDHMNTYDHRDTLSYLKDFEDDDDEVAEETGLESIIPPQPRTLSRQPTQVPTSDSNDSSIKSEKKVPMRPGAGSRKEEVSHKIEGDGKFKIIKNNNIFIYMQTLQLKIRHFVI